jgi:hypothetical protein
MKISPGVFQPRPNEHTELGRALLAVPGLADLVDRTGQLRRTAVPRTATPPDVLIAAAAGRVRAGEHFDLAELGEALLDAQHDQRLADLVSGAKTGILDRLENQAEHLVMQHLGAALEVLARSLADVLEQARQADRLLGPITTADQALNANKKAQDSWRMLGVLADRYAEIRAGQAKLTGLVWDREGVGEALARFAGSAETSCGHAMIVRRPRHHGRLRRVAGPRSRRSACRSCDG